MSFRIQTIGASFLSSIYFYFACVKITVRYSPIWKHFTVEWQMNECSEIEFRCHMGLCIPRDDLSEDDQDSDCLDQSDTLDTQNSAVWSSINGIFRRDEHMCRSSPEKFSCGNGQCMKDLDPCLNGRHLSLVASMSARGNLSHQCWLAMICLTKMIDQPNGTSSQQLLTSPDFSIYAHNCTNMVEFPTIPVLYGHVRFLYNLTDADQIKIKQVLIPDYICFGEKLCDFLASNYHHENRTCGKTHQ